MLKLTIIGNLGSDAIIQQTNNGSFAKFSVAINESYTDKNGQKVEKSTWVDCILNNSNHGAIPFIKKGGKIYVEGSLKVNKYKKDPQSETMIQISCNVQQLQLLGSPKTQDNNQAPTDNNTPA
jgi:single-strand DNA-binding protein